MITNDRLNHILAVARLMKNRCIEQNKDDSYTKDMFTLGLLHDIGYEFGENFNHSEVGGDMLKNQGYKYYNEIKFHGDPNANYSSPELDLLNFADMHTNGKGEYVSFEERLVDIASRRGKDSEAYKTSKQTIEKLIQKGFN